MGIFFFFEFFTTLPFFLHLLEEMSNNITVDRPVWLFFYNSSFRSVVLLLLFIFVCKCCTVFRTELDFLSVWQHNVPPFGWILPLLMLLL